jgi:hypothetical protein
MKSVSTVVLLTLLSAAGANPLERRQVGKGKGKSGGSGLSAMLGSVLNGNWTRSGVRLYKS